MFFSTNNRHNVERFLLVITTACLDSTKRKISLFYSTIKIIMVICVLYVFVFEREGMPVLHLATKVMYVFFPVTYQIIYRERL